MPVRAAALTVLLLGGCTRDPFVSPGPCTVYEVRERAVLHYPRRFRLVALVDRDGVPPGDAASAIERVAAVLRSGRIFSDGELSFWPPGEVEVVIRDVSFDVPIATLLEPHLPVDSRVDRTEPVVIVITARDVAAQSADELLGAFSNPDFLTFVVIGGVPPELVDIDDAHYDIILSDPRMSPSSSIACNTLGGIAVPPARAATGLARDIEAAGANCNVGSICDPRWDQVVLALALRRFSTCCGTCFLLDFERRLPDGRIPCTLYEEPPADIDCASLPGRTPAPTPEAPNRCSIAQRASLDGGPTNTPGWYYDDASEQAQLLCGSGQILASSYDVVPIPGSYLYVECTAHRGACVDAGRDAD